MGITVAVDTAGPVSVERVSLVLREEVTVASPVLVLTRVGETAQEAKGTRLQGGQVLSS